MTERCLELSYEGPVAHLQLTRPEANNTLVSTFWSELGSSVREIDANGRARALVISSTGRHFSAGLDLSVVEGAGLFRGGPDAAEPGRKRALLYQGIRTLQAAFAVVEQARIPVIAAVQGACVGAAVGLVAACDLRYATNDAFFLLPETGIGITPDVGQLQRLPRLLPEGVVREMTYRGTRLTAARAESLGFVNGLFGDQEALITAVSRIGAEIAAKSPLAIWGAKHAIGYARDHSLDDGLEHVALWQAGMYYPDDCLESLAAQREGRDPSFDDLLATP